MRLSDCQSVKLRDLLDASEADPLSDTHIRWAAHDHPHLANIIDLGSLQRPGRYAAGLRMFYFDCNAPGTTGYSVATDGISIFSIHAHRQDDDTRIYADVGSSCHWIYMPLDAGEYLTEISRRYGVYACMDCFGLMVRY